MSASKSAITIDKNTQKRQGSVAEKLTRIDKSRLAKESAKLDPAYEQSIADEGLASELAERPKY